MRKVWIAAFLISFAVTAISISFLKFTNQEVMMNATELGWYYILYLFASLMVVLGIINIWIFRKPLWKVLFAKEPSADTVDDDGDDEDDEDKL